MLQDDIVLERKLAEGGFGVVFKGKLIESDGSERDIVVKKVG